MYTALLHMGVDEDTAEKVADDMVGGNHDRSISFEQFQRVFATLNSMDGDEDEDMQSSDSDDNIGGTPVPLDSALQRGNREQHFDHRRPSGHSGRVR